MKLLNLKNYQWSMNKDYHWVLQKLYTHHLYVLVYLIMGHAISYDLEGNEKNKSWDWGATNLRNGMNG